VLNLWAHHHRRGTLAILATVQHPDRALHCIGNVDEVLLRREQQLVCTIHPKLSCPGLFIKTSDPGPSLHCLNSTQLWQGVHSAVQGAGIQVDDGIPGVGHLIPGVRMPGVGLMQLTRQCCACQ
jgi:hypothetical protein